MYYIVVRYKIHLITSNIIIVKIITIPRDLIYLFTIRLSK